jgi:hypothetical protein
MCRVPICPAPSGRASGLKCANRFPGQCHGRIHVGCGLIYPARCKLPEFAGIASRLNGTQSDLPIADTAKRLNAKRSVDPVTGTDGERNHQTLPSLILK